MSTFDQSPLRRSATIVPSDSPGKPRMQNRRRGRWDHMPRDRNLTSMPFSTAGIGSHGVRKCATRKSERVSGRPPSVSPHLLMGPGAPTHSRSQYSLRPGAHPIAYPGEIQRTQLRTPRTFHTTPVMDRAFIDEGMRQRTIPCIHRPICLGATPALLLRNAPPC
jgi:hypothetical protein